MIFSVNKNKHCRLQARTESVIKLKIFKICNSWPVQGFGRLEGGDWMGTKEGLMKVVYKNMN